MAIGLLEVSLMGLTTALYLSGFMFIIISDSIEIASVFFLIFDNQVNSIRFKLNARRARPFIINVKDDDFFAQTIPEPEPFQAHSHVIVITAIRLPALVIPVDEVQNLLRRQNEAIPIR